MMTLLTDKPGTRPIRPGSRHRRGAVLVVGLIILAVMTILGLSTLRGTALEERMAGNLKDSNDALQAAEAALQAAISAIERSNRPPPTGNWPDWDAGSIDDACKVGHSDADCKANTELGDNWLDPASTEAPDGTLFEDFTGSSFGRTGWEQPRIIIRHRWIQPVDATEQYRGVGKHFYTVSAVAMGPSGQSRIVLRTTIMKEYD